MKPVVKWVDGEPRVWFPKGEKDANGKQMFLGDKMKTPNLNGSCSDSPSNFEFTVRAGGRSWPEGVRVSSPGIPCEVELPPHLWPGCEGSA